MPFPIVVNLEKRRCVVVGAGRVAERRVNSLLRSDASVRLVAPQATPNLRGLAQSGKLLWMRDLYTPEHLEGAFLVVAATDEFRINEAVTRDAVERNMLVCNVSEPSEGNFITPSTIERGDLLISITTGSKSPTLAAIVRERLEEQFGEEWAGWTELCGRIRGDVQQIPTEGGRRDALKTVLSNEIIGRYLTESNMAAAEKEAKRCILSLLA